jgi:predicted MFS family arabinose efflux permease
MASNQTLAADAGAAPAPRPSAGPVIFETTTGRAVAVIVVLMLVNVVNFIDRQLPFILIESIKADLKLTDGEIGLMAGIAFAVVFSAAALPLAYLADRWSSRHMLAITLSVWSLCTALSGLATSFMGLLLARAGVAASEAGCGPAAHALIARSFPKRRMAMILALFSLGVPIGSMIGLALGGWINDVADWKTAFFVVGLPGLLLALVAWLVLPNSAATPHVTGKQESFMSGVKYLFKLRSFSHMAAGSALYACGSYAMNVFASAFLIRVHGLTTAEAGLSFGLAFGIGGLIGTFAGGWLADYLGKRDPKWRQLVPAIGQLLSFPTAIGAWLVPDVSVSIVLLTLSYVFGLLYFAPSFAVAQSLAPDRVRATASAVLGLCLTLIGSSVGPIVVGGLSDYLQPQYGNLALRYAMCAMGITILWSAVHFWLASRALPADLKRTQAQGA